MTMRYYHPCPELRQLVSRILIFRYALDPDQPRITNPFPPHPENCLYFYPYDAVTCRNYANGQLLELPRSILVGPQLARVDLTMGFRMLVVMVCFQPGGMHRLLRIPMHELLGHPVESALVLGRDIETVTARLAETEDFDTMNALVQSYLRGKAKSLKRRLPVEEVLAGMIRKNSVLNIDELARHACVSIRQLERQFHERTGMPPKTFARLVRFSRAWVMRENNPGLSWLQIAHACAYADQMHMIRDFKDFAGVTPGLLQKDLEKSSLRLQGPTFE